jgi:hypothetical protein
MNKKIQFVLCSLLVAASISAIPAKAATNGAGNVFLTVSLSLNGMAQTNAVGLGRMRLSTRDVIAAIGHDTTNVFAPDAKLLLKFPVGLNAGPSFVIRSIANRTNIVDFDVPSTMLWLIQIGYPVASMKTAGGIVTSSQVGIWELEFQSSRGSFDVQGYTIAMLDNRGNPGKILADIGPRTISARVAGTGCDAKENSTVLQGTVLVNGRKVVDVSL